MKCYIDGLNQARIELGRISLYFSYHTLVAIGVGGRTYKTATKYSRTTSKHMASIPGPVDEENFKILENSLHDVLDVWYSEGHDAALDAAQRENIKKIVEIKL